jgi:hypothetical protein
MIAASRRSLRIDNADLDQILQKASRSAGANTNPA